MRYVVDIDDTICYYIGENKDFDYSKALQNPSMISYFNRLYDVGHEIVYFTARGTGTGKDWREVTENQFKEWGVKYHELHFGKPIGDYFIDDKNILISQITEKKELEKGRIVVKDWGKEYILEQNYAYTMKRLVINKNCNISKQFHKHKMETWHIVEGTGLVFLNNTILHVSPGQTFHIPPKVVHQAKAITELHIVECSTADSGDDIVRLDKEWNN